MGKGVPLSATVAKDLEARLDILGGQDMFELYISRKVCKRITFPCMMKTLMVFGSNIIEYIEDRKS